MCVARLEAIDSVFEGAYVHWLQCRTHAVCHQEKTKDKQTVNSCNDDDRDESIAIDSI